MFRLKERGWSASDRAYKKVDGSRCFLRFFLGGRVASGMKRDELGRGWKRDELCRRVAWLVIYSP